jgi:protein-tyrosine-phosphatase
MTLATFLVFLISVVAPAAQPVRQPAVVFVCEHGTAKSVIATAYFNKLARERGLPYRATFRGTDPQAELSVSAPAGLRADGVEIPEGKPAAISAADVSGATHIVAIGCTLPTSATASGKASDWSDVPDGKGYAATRDAIRRHVVQLLDQLGSPEAAAAQNAAAGKKTIDFENEAVNSAPRGFAFTHTGGRGTPGRWIVVADRGGKVLAQTDADRTNDRFPMAVVNDVMARDLNLSVRFKPVSGKVDQAAGLVWRYQDENNYYIVRANALEGNVVLYKVEKGRRTDLPINGEGRTYGKKAPVPSGEWSQLSVSAKGSAFRVLLNGKLLYEVDDATFTGEGKVGVWTKADSVTHFDDLTVTVQ